MGCDFHVAVRSREVTGNTVLENIESTMYYVGRKRQLKVGSIFYGSMSVFTRMEGCQKGPKEKKGFRLVAIRAHCFLVNIFPQDQDHKMKERKKEA